MEYNLNDYVNNIKGKVIMICCNDCCAMSTIIHNENILVYTSFGNFISPENKEDIDFFDFCIKNEGVATIIIAGHFNCKIIKHIWTNGTENAKWINMQKSLRKLENEYDSTISVSENEKEIIRKYIFDQVNYISQNSFLERYLSSGKLIIKGIIIDDLNKNRVEELCKIPIKYNGIK